MIGLRSHWPASARHGLLLTLITLAMAGLVLRSGYLQLYEHDFLRGQGDARHLRTVATPAHRGMITDRNGAPLAISTPVDSVWANPQKMAPQASKLDALAALLHVDGQALAKRLKQRAARQFVYLKRHIKPASGRRVKALDIPGIHLQRESRRYYPMGAAAAHVLGFTDIDEKGLEGIELAFNDWLSGTPGSKRVVRDSLGDVVENVRRIQASRPGNDLALSLDRRIQYLAYRELKAQVARHGAHSGSAVVLDPDSGEVLAMVNQPGFNPNRRRHLRPARYRNRAVTDVFEPGSAIKPFTVIAGLRSGRFSPQTIISTSPGWFMVRGHTIQDEHDYGDVDLTKLLYKSSNVGAAKMALSIPPKTMWQVYRRVGIGQTTGSGFPGEAGGQLSAFDRWGKFERATLAFGYGMSVTPLQLARAYATIAADGLRPRITFLREDRAQAGRRVIAARRARRLRHMLQRVVSPEGTAERAAIEGYSVAGKTGTVHKPTAQGYAADHYDAVFAGMVPASDPKLVMVVEIDDPETGGYFGGLVAAPVFSRVMAGALRILNIPPDDLPTQQVNAAGEGPGSA